MVVINELESRASIETPCRGFLFVDDSIEHISYANNLTLKFDSDLWGTAQRWGRFTWDDTISPTEVSAVLLAGKRIVVLQNEPGRSHQGATDSVTEGCNEHDRQGMHDDDTWIIEDIYPLPAGMNLRIMEYSIHYLQSTSYFGGRKTIHSMTGSVQAHKRENWLCPPS